MMVPPPVLPGARLFPAWGQGGRTPSDLPREENNGLSFCSQLPGIDVRSGARDGVRGGSSKGRGTERGRGRGAMEESKGRRAVDLEAGEGTAASLDETRHKQDQDQEQMEV